MLTVLTIDENYFASKLAELNKENAPERDYAAVYSQKATHYLGEACKALFLEEIQKCMKAIDYSDPKYAELVVTKEKIAAGRYPGDSCSQWPVSMTEYLPVPFEDIATRKGDEWMLVGPEAMATYFTRAAIARSEINKIAKNPHLAKLEKLDTYQRPNTDVPTTPYTALGKMHVGFEGYVFKSLEEVSGFGKMALRNLYGEVPGREGQQMQRMAEKLAKEHEKLLTGLAQQLMTRHRDELGEVAASEEYSPAVKALLQKAHEAAKTAVVYMDGHNSSLAAAKRVQA